MNFHVKNIINEPRSTLFAVLLTGVLLLFVWTGKTDFMSVSPALMLVIPFLLYGKDNNNDNNNNRPMPPIAIVLLLLVISCKPQQVIKDVQILRDTVYLKGETIERNFYYNQKDTVFVKGDKLTMKYYYHTHDSTVFLQGNCKADTIYLEKLVPFEKQVVVEKEKGFDWKLFTIMSVFAVFLLIVGLVIGKVLY